MTDLKQRDGDQVLPSHNDEVDCQTRLINWIAQEVPPRRELGILRYGTALQPFNGRSSVRDLGEELLDAATYFQQVRAEMNALCEVLAKIVTNWGNSEDLRAGERLLMELGWYEHGAY